MGRSQEFEVARWHPLSAGQRTPAVLYDNHHPKGHHKHIGGRQSAYQFSSVEDLLRDFRRDIEALK